MTSICNLIYTADCSTEYSMLCVRYVCLNQVKIFITEMENAIMVKQHNFLLSILELA